MIRVRFLRSAVRLRRWRRRPVVAARLARLRRGLPYASSIVLNLLILLILGLGYASFAVRGIEDGGIGERVVKVELFERIPAAKTPEAVPEPPEEQETQEEAEIGSDTLPEGVTVAEGQEAQDDETGQEVPDEELGQDVATTALGVEVPSIAVPEVDPGEGRPDGVVGVDCYAIFRDDRDKALECAGREILSGWRAELAKLETDWDRFSRELGTEGRQIRYGPLRGAVPPELRGFEGQHVVNGVVVPKEVAERYAREVARIRKRALEREFGKPVTDLEKGSRERLEKSRDASTYDPLQPEVSLPEG